MESTSATVPTDIATTVAPSKYGSTDIIDMDHRLDQKQSSDYSPIIDFYKRRSVFITGGSGFMGKVLIEKLLRSCTDIEKIYILLRHKRNRQPRERLNDLVSSPLFGVVRAKDCRLLEKIVVVEGDVSLDKMGLSEHDVNRLAEDVSVVFHSAATVKFDEPLKQSVAINVTGTKNIIELCRKLPKLRALVHVSTAYANCDKKSVDEKIYPTEDDPEKLMDLSEWMEEEVMQLLKAKLLRQRPNTYTYTKALAESLLLKKAGDLPVVICRPSIVVASWREPFRGWIDNMNGPTGVVLACGKGLVRTMLADANCRADIIPVDTVINLMITLGWQVARKQQGHQQQAGHCNRQQHHISLPATMVKDYVDSVGGEDNSKSLQATEKNLNNDDKVTITTTIASKSNSPPNKIADCESSSDNNRDSIRMVDSGSTDTIEVFHCTSGFLNPITWSFLNYLVVVMLRLYPSLQVFRYPSGKFEHRYYVDFFYRVTLHYMPAYILDWMTKLSGGKPILVRIYQKFDQAALVLSAFTMRDWDFKSDNIVKLQKEMSPHDRKTFHCDIRHLHWETFFSSYALGVRRYLLKESPASLPQARRNLKRVYYRNLLLQIIFVALLVYYVVVSNNAINNSVQHIKTAVKMIFPDRYTPVTSARAWSQPPTNSNQAFVSGSACLMSTVASNQN